MEFYLTQSNHKGEIEEIKGTKYESRVIDGIIEIESLEELMEFCEIVDSIVIIPHDDGTKTLEIYNDYRE